jgi:hypothetical protein
MDWRIRVRVLAEIGIILFASAFYTKPKIHTLPTTYASLIAPMYATHSTHPILLIS